MRVSEGRDTTTKRVHNDNNELSFIILMKCKADWVQEVKESLLVIENYQFESGCEELMIKTRMIIKIGEDEKRDKN
jgi:hypothetical protein